MGKTKKAWTVHPGEILRTEFMEPMKITAYRLAKDLDFPGIYDVLRCKRAISAETALRLGKYFGLPAQFWMNLQAEHDLRLAGSDGQTGEGQGQNGRLIHAFSQLWAFAPRRIHAKIVDRYRYRIRNAIFCNMK